jgi:ComF family protein
MSAGQALGGWMAGMLPRFPELWGADIIIPVPLHPKRLRERGFNQAAILARYVACVYKKPIEEILERKRHTLPQWRLTRNGRTANLREAFEVRTGIQLAGKSMLLIDDVCTTGATLESCAQTLKAAGAARICAFVLARD